MSSLGDLLLGNVKKEQSPNVTPDNNNRGDDEKQYHQVKKHDEEIESTINNEFNPSSHNSQVFVERIEKSNVVDDTKSNASSTDDYVRELLDPDDRPRNVWHVVEGPKIKESPDKSGSDKQSRSPSRLHNQRRREHDSDEDEDASSRFAGKKLDDGNYNREQDNISPTHQQIENNRAVARDRGHSRSKDLKEHDRRHVDESGDRSSSSRRHHREHRSDKDTRDRRDRDRDRSRDRDKHKSARRSSDRHSKSRRRYDSDDDDDYDDVVDDDSSKRRRRRHGGSSSSRHRGGRSHSRSRSRSRSRSISRRRNRSKSNSHSPLTQRNSRTILIMQLSPRVESSHLEEYFSKLGRVREVRLIINSKTRRHKGIAYIEFEEAEFASQALALDGQEFYGAPMRIQLAKLDRNSGDDWKQSSSSSAHQYSSSHSQHHSTNHTQSSHLSTRSHPPPNSYRIYIGSLHVGITEDMLRSIVEPFGPILKLELMRDRTTGMSRGYAFVLYANSDDGQEAVRNLDGFELAGKNLRVSKSLEKGEQQQQLLYH